MYFKIDNINRVVLLGGGALLLALVRWCKSESTNISVVTAPRHAKEIVENGKSLKSILSNEKVPFLVTKDIDSDEVAKFLGDFNSTFYLSIGAAWIFKQNIIKNLFNGKLLNLHGTRLPQNRGGGGFSWQIMMGNRLGFCQLHLVETGVDTGNIVKTKEFLYPPYCRIPKHYQEIYIKKNIDFVASFIQEIRQGGIAIETTKQAEYFSSYFPRLSTREHGWINWNDEIMQLERFICAFDEPYEGAKCFWRDQTVFIKKVCVDLHDQNFHPYQSGIVYRKNDNWLNVCAKGGSLIIEDITDSKGNNLIQKIKVGDRLITKSKTLDERKKRVLFLPSGEKKSK